MNMAREYYDTMQSNAKKHRREDLGNGENASDLLTAIRQVAYGQVNDTDDVITVCKLFRDDVMIDNLDKAQITSIAKYLNVLTIGGDEMTRVALRTRLRSIIREDRELYFEVGMMRHVNSRGCRVLPNRSWSSAVS